MRTVVIIGFCAILLGCVKPSPFYRVVKLADGTCEVQYNRLLIGNGWTPSLLQYGTCAEGLQFAKQNYYDEHSAAKTKRVSEVLWP